MSTRDCRCSEVCSRVSDRRTSAAQAELGRSTLKRRAVHKLGRPPTHSQRTRMSEARGRVRGSLNLFECSLPLRARDRAKVSAIPLKESWTAGYCLRRQRCGPAGLRMALAPEDRAVAPRRPIASVPGPIIRWKYLFGLFSWRGTFSPSAQASLFHSRRGSPVRAEIPARRARNAGGSRRDA